MTDAVIVSTAQNPIERARRGAFNDTISPTLTAHAIRHAVGHAGIDDAVLGSALDAGSAAPDMPRLALAAGLCEVA